MTFVVRLGVVAVLISDTTLLSFHIRHSTLPSDTRMDLCSPRFSTLFSRVASRCSLGHFFLFVLAVAQQKVFLDRRVSAIRTLEKKLSKYRIYALSR